MRWSFQQSADWQCHKGCATTLGVARCLFIVCKMVIARQYFTQRDGCLSPLLLISPSPCWSGTSLCALVQMLESRPSTFPRKSHLWWQGRYVEGGKMSFVRGMHYSIFLLVPVGDSRCTWRASQWPEALLFIDVCQRMPHPPHSDGLVERFSSVAFKNLWYRYQYQYPYSDTNTDRLAKTSCRGFTEQHGVECHYRRSTHSLSRPQGCDSGFGHVLAKRLSEMGVMVFAGVLDVNGAGAQQLREGASENLQVLQLDVTDGSHIETARRYICTQVADTGETERTRCWFLLWFPEFRNNIFLRWGNCQTWIWTNKLPFLIQIVFNWC